MMNKSLLEIATNFRRIYYFKADLVRTHRISLTEHMLSIQFLTDIINRRHMTVNGPLQ
jgi:hypothetical protein